MSEHEANHDQGQGMDGSLAVRLRAAADGELDQATREALESHLARSLEDRARIQFEQELRVSVGRVMGGVKAPDSLRARVGEIISASRGAGDAPARTVEHSAAPERADTHAHRHAPERVAAKTRRRSFWTRRQAMGALAAAAVLLVASVFIVRMAGVSTVPLNAGQEAYRAELVHHVAGEHNRITHDPAAASAKLGMQEPEEVERFFSEVIASPSEEVHKLIQTTSSCAFKGAGNCHVPRVRGAAAHIQLVVDAGGKPVPVSVFVCADPGELPLKPGVTYVLDTKACGEGGTRVLTWTDGRLLYVVVSDAKDEACPSVLARLGRKGPSQRL